MLTVLHDCPALKQEGMKEMMARQPNLMGSQISTGSGESGGNSPRFAAVRLLHIRSRQGLELRGGFTIIEMIGTCLLLGILFSMTIPMLLLVARERRSAEQRQFAMQQAANLLERATKRDWSDLEPGELSIPDPDRDLQAVLPGLQQTLVVKQLADEFDSRQIIASIRWQNRAGELVSPLRLSAWVHSMKEVP
jgi:type II secretory pathway pseudopilin PulG